MKKLLYLIISILLISCDDGDLIVENLEFENATVESCDIPTDEEISDYLFYIIDDIDFETISLSLNTTDNILSESGVYGPYSLTTNSLEYRILNGAAGSDYYCNDIPPSSPTTTQTFIGEAGNIMITTTIVEDDNDGISSEDEGINLLNLSLSQDTDNDGLPDYIDEDDDGDNVPTINEGINITDLALSQDTDNDGIPDYLDDDDDDDGIPTIQEDINRDFNPRNDILGTTPNYLNNMATEMAMPAIDRFIEHSFTNTASLEITVEDLTAVSNNSEIVFALYEFGTFIRTLEISTIPNF